MKFIAIPDNNTVHLGDCQALMRLVYLDKGAKLQEVAESMSTIAKDFNIEGLPHA